MDLGHLTRCLVYLYVNLLFFQKKDDRTREMNKILLCEVINFPLMYKNIKNLWQLYSISDDYWENGIINDFTSKIKTLRSCTFAPRPSFVHSINELPCSPSSPYLRLLTLKLFLSCFSTEVHELQLRQFIAAWPRWVFICLIVWLLGI